MPSELSTVERAFQLARGGKCRSVDDIRKTLKAERRDAVDSHLTSSTLCKQLRSAITTV